MGRTRREVLVAGAAVAAACATDEAGGGSTGEGGRGGEPSEAGGGAGGSGPQGWATGGTADMSGAYPDPFVNAPGTPCELTCSAILGPCWTESEERKDISEGVRGLPVRFAFRLVDEDCRPVPGAVLDFWHTAPNGAYSSAEVPRSCTLGNALAERSMWFRGVQVADANGRVDFDSCFPGWYPGRTIHVHFTVRVGGVASVTGQLIFDDELSDEIVATLPVYSARGPRDTNNETDAFVGVRSGPGYVFEHARQDDGALLAWKTIVLRSDTGEPLCRVRV